MDQVSLITHQHCWNKSFFYSRFKSNFLVNGPGFKIRFNSVTSSLNECGGNFSEPHGVLTSPSYPNNYPSDTDCTYIISQPIDTFVNITILDLDTEYDSSLYTWCYDYLEIRDGNSDDSPLLGKLCGNNTVNNLNDTTIISTQNQVWLRYGKRKKRKEKVLSRFPIFHLDSILMMMKTLLGEDLPSTIQLTRCHS